MAKGYNIMEIVHKMLPYNFCFKDLTKNTEVVKWCEENCKNNFFVSGIYVYFETEYDAMLYRLSIL